MQDKYILLWLDVLPFVAGGLTMIFFMVLFKDGRTQQIILKSCEEFSGLLAEKARGLSWYQKKSEWLNRNGASFHYGKWIDPLWYLTLKIVMSILGVFICMGIAPGYAVITAIFLYALPCWLLIYLNTKDNEALLPELRLVYHALEIQIRAGVYVTDALAECYGCVQEKRIKQAFLDLAGDIVMKADIYESLEHFQKKFDNRYIDALCITLLQALESGQAVELLNDISEQIKDMEIAVIGRKKGALDRSITFYQLGILAAVLGMVLYACVTQMFAAAVNL